MAASTKAYSITTENWTEITTGEGMVVAQVRKGKGIELAVAATAGELSSLTAGHFLGRGMAIALPSCPGKVYARLCEGPEAVLMIVTAY